MPVLLALLLGVLAHAPAAVAQPRSTAGGFPVAPSRDPEFSPNVVPDGSGGAVIAWERSHPDSGGIYAVGLDGNGNVRPGWHPRGRVVHGGGDPDMVADGAGGAYIASRSFSRIAVQHFGPSEPVAAYAPATVSDPSATPGPGTAQPLRTQHNGIVMPVVALDGQGGMYVAYMDEQRFYEEAFVTHHSFGQPIRTVELRGRPGCSISFCPTRTPTLCPDGSGGVFVVWGEVCGLRVLRLDAALAPSPGWPDSGLALEPCRAYRPYVGICPDREGGAYVAWQGGWSGPRDLRIQRVTGAGTITAGWPDTGLVLSPHATLPGLARYYYGSFCAIVPDGLGGALVSWTDQSADAGDAYVTRVMPDATIAPGWPRDGVGVGVAPGTQQWPVVAADGAGGAIVAWEDARNSPDLAIYTNHVSAAGEVVPPGRAEGVAVSEGPGRRLKPRLAPDGAGGAYIVWTSYTTDNADIHAARILADGVVGTFVGLLGAGADPEGVHLEWRVSGDVTGPLQLERRTEDLDFTPLASLTPDSLGRAAFLDRDVELEHRYGYRLGYTGSQGPAYTEEVWVTVLPPPPPPPVLAFAGVHPNPAVDLVAVSFVLPAGQEAWIEIVDPAGRLRARREVGSLGPGPHQVTFGAETALAAGLYFIRLHCGGEVRTARFCVLR